MLERTLFNLARSSIGFLFYYTSTALFRLQNSYIFFEVRLLWRLMLEWNDKQVYSFPLASWKKCKCFAHCIKKRIYIFIVLGYLVIIWFKLNFSIAGYSSITVVGFVWLTFSSSCYLTLPFLPLAMGWHVLWRNKQLKTLLCFHIMDIFVVYILLGIKP